MKKKNKRAGQDFIKNEQPLQPEFDERPGQIVFADEENKQSPEEAQPDEAEESDVPLEDVAITDEDLAQEDQQAKLANKSAKKNAKLLKTPEQLERDRLRKNILITGLLVLILVIIVAVPFTRHLFLNAFGVRHSMKVKVIDRESKKPIIEASVYGNGKLAGKTDNQGIITIQKLSLGQSRIYAEKPGFSHEEMTITNELWLRDTINLSLKAIGMRLDVDLKHWLSGSPIEGATVKYGESISAKSDQNGRVSLIIPPTDEDKIKVDIAADGYLPRTLETDTKAAVREITLVSAIKDYFISKRDGKLDIFSANLDGSDQRKIIEATGKEDERLTQWTINRHNKQAILIATREGKKINGRIIAGIYAVDLAAASLKKVDEGSDVQIVGWAEDTIIYTKTTPELNYDDPAFTRLTSYNVVTNKLAQLTQSNYFGGLAVAQNKVFFMPEDAYRPVENANYTSIDLSNNAKQTYLTVQRISYAITNEYDFLRVGTFEDKQYKIKVRGGAVAQTDNANPNSVEFALSPKGDQVVWTDKRDGQGVLIVRAAGGGEERQVAKTGGMINPVRFIADDMAVVRVVTNQETADYLVHLGTGKMLKIVDVSNVGLFRYGSGY